MKLWDIALAILALALAAPAGAECVAAPDLAPNVENATQNATLGAAGPTHTERNGRVIVPMQVNGRGPYRFIVDTGANRSALSFGLAQVLGLVPNGMGDVHSIDGVQPAPMVAVNSLNYGPVALANAALPLLQGPMLGGEEGILGVDGMQGKRLKLDFDRRCIEIIPASTAPRLHGWAQMRGELRFGHLVVVQGRVGTLRVNVLIDTGSDLSLGNVAFRTALQGVRIRPNALSFEHAYTAGRPIILGNAAIVPTVRLGEISITDLTAYIGDYHIFALWGLLEEPTLLIGMDVLSRSRGIAIDYERGLVHIRLPRI